MKEESQLPSLGRKPVVVVNLTKGSVVCTHARFADTFSKRLVGLLGSKGLASGAGLLIRPSSGVHTIGMSFPIDIVSLDKRDRVLKTFHSIGPWKIRGMSAKTRSVLELPAGQILQCGIEPGDDLAFNPA